MTTVQNSNQTVDVVIIGAGPYGMAVAAYLKERGVNFRIYGNPMSLWLKHMPKGMHLKSEGFASFIYDPNLSFTLADYCKEQGLAYADQGLPVPLETFTAYGLEFQKRILPEQPCLVSRPKNPEEHFQRAPMCIFRSFSKQHD